MPRFPRSWPWWRQVLTGLTAVALALSAYLSWHYLVGRSMIGCGGGSPCAQVLGSRWASIGGVVPVSGLAAGAYLAMLVATFFLGPATATPVRRLAWGAMLVLVGAAAGSAVWFVIVQKWIVGAFCGYCMATHLSGVLLAALVVWQAPRRFDDDSIPVALTDPAPARLEDESLSAGESQRRTEDGTRMKVLRRLSSFPIGPVSIGLVLAGILAACQVGIAPPPVYVGGESQDKKGLPDLDPHAVPLVGSPDAPYVVTLLFDYKCPHCQQMHFLLNEVVRRYQGKLAFALCPAPLERRCNPYIPHDVEEFKGACELAQIGLAVWLAKREAFPAFETWMFSLESGDFWRPRSLDAAQAKAVEMIGQAQYEAARANPWIDRYLTHSIRIYGNSIAGGNAVPKLIFGSRWVIPQPHDADDLVKILQDRLAVPKP